MTTLESAAILFGLTVILWLLTSIERRIVKLQRWVEMHAEPAPPLSEEEIEKRRKYRPMLGYNAEDIEREINVEQRRRRRSTLARYVRDLRQTERRASKDGAYDIAAELLLEANRLERDFHK